MFEQSIGGFTGTTETAVDRIYMTPEPATVLLLALSGLAVMWRRR